MAKTKNQKHLFEQLMEITDRGDFIEIMMFLENQENTFKQRKQNDALSEDYLEELDKMFCLLETFVDDTDEMPPEIREILATKEWAKFTQKRIDEKRKEASERAFNQLDETEKEEFQDIYDILWGMDARKRILSEYFDWNEDANVHSEMEIPRKIPERELTEYKTGLTLCLSNMLYNRATILILTFQPKNRFELYGINFDEDGHWIPLHPNKLKEFAEGDEGVKDMFDVNGHISYKALKRTNPIKNSKLGGTNIVEFKRT